MATVTFDHITKAYADGTIAVNDLDLLIKDGALAPDFDDQVIADSCVTRDQTVGEG